MYRVTYTVNGRNVEKHFRKSKNALEFFNKISKKYPASLVIL